MASHHPARSPSSHPFGRPTNKSWMAFGAVTFLAVSAATAQVAAGSTGIDASGNYQQEVQACQTGNTQQAIDTCLTEARNARADKEKGALDAHNAGELQSNATARCDVFSGEDRAACQARMLGFGDASGSVAGGGVLREVETVVVPADADTVIIEPKTRQPVLLVPLP